MTKQTPLRGPTPTARPVPTTAEITFYGKACANRTRQLVEIEMVSLQRLRTGKRKNFPFSAEGAMLSGHAWLGVKTAASHPESMLNPQGTHAFAVKCQASMVLHTIRESMAPTNQEVIHPNDPKPRRLPSLREYPRAR